MNDIPLNWFLYFAAASFAIGLIGVLVRRNAIAVLMAIEIMLNAANINLVAFWRYGTPPSTEGPQPLGGVVFALFVITIAAAEVAVGIGLDPALLPALACRGRRPLRQPLGLSGSSCPLPRLNRV